MGMRVHRSAGASAHWIMPPTYRPIRCAVTRVAVRASTCDGRPRSHYHPARSTRRRCHERWPPAVVRYRVSHAQMHQHALKCSCDRSSGVKRVRVLYNDMALRSKDPARGRGHVEWSRATAVAAVLLGRMRYLGAGGTRLRRKR